MLVSVPIVPTVRLLLGLVLPIPTLPLLAKCQWGAVVVV
jgi:hypothetical protein